MPIITTSASHLAVEAMNAWSSAAVAHLQLSSPSLLEALRERLGVLGHFSRATFPQVVHSLPVLYPFSGSDLLTAYALFPHAPSYNLVADFPTGDPTCFLDADCAARANESASAFFKHWANLRFARQSTNLMRRAFATSGQLPALLLSLRLMGQPVIHTSLEVTGPAGADDAARPQAGAPNTAVAHGRRLLKGGGGGGGQHNGGHYHRLANGVTLHNGSKPTTTAKPAGGKAYSKAAAAAAAAAAASPSDLQLPSVTVHTARCRVTYTSMLLRSDPSEKATVKQFWPVMSRWAKGGAYIDAQLDVLAEILGAATATSMTQGTTISSSMSSAAAASASAVGGGVANGPVGLDANPLAGLAPQRLFVSMFKAAPHWILRNDWMARWVLQRSHATLHDETGLRPRAYNATGTLTDVAWQTRTFGAFIEFENREVKWYANEKAELKAIFRDQRTLPFQFGYAQQVGSHGVLLAAWRSTTA